MKRLSDNQGQQTHYRNLVNVAYAAEAARLKGELPTKEDWRRELNLDTTGHYSTKEMNQTTDFDAVMMELAIMADDYYWINRLSTANERRLRHIIQWFMHDLEYLTKEQVRWGYIQGICKQAGYSDSLLDCPITDLTKVMQMVDTHVRRLAKDQGIARADLPSSDIRKGHSAAEVATKFNLEIAA